MEYLEQFFVKKYEELENQNALLKKQNDMMRWLLENLYLKYLSETPDIRAMRVLHGEKLKVAEEYLDVLGIPYGKIEEPKVEEKPMIDTAKPIVNVHFRDVVSIVKKRMGLTDQQLANKIGVLQSMVTNWRNGVFMPRKANKQKILDLWEKVKQPDEMNVVVVD